jgi:ribosomal protein L10
MPFVGKEAFPIMSYLDELRENRTGISKAAAGLDAAALQSSTASAVNATVSQAQQHIEMIARIFAETGMKQLFKGILRLITTHQDEERMTRLNNQFVPIDPASWNADMDVVSNVALGQGTDSEKIAALSQIAGKQEELMKLLGPVNALVSPKQYSNTLAKIVELSGFKDPSMFINALQDGQPLVPPEVSQNKKKSPEELLAEVQAQSIQADIQKKAAELELKRDEMMRKDDLERDKLDVDIHMRAAEIESKNGATVNVAQIRADVDRDREMIKGIQAGRGVR